MKKKLFNRVVEGFDLQPKDVAVLQRLVDLHHNSSVEADDQFDKVIATVGKGSPVLKALEKYQKMSAYPNKLVVLVQVLAGDLKKIFGHLWKKEFKNAWDCSENLLRNICIVVITGTDYGERLYQRMLITKVGYLSGNVSALDDRYAEDHNMQPLTAFELWLMRDLIEIEREKHRDIWIEVMKDLY